MSALSKIFREAESDRLSFWCPGCKTSHTIRHGPDGWGWNGSVEKPTFTPSVLFRSGHYAPGFSSNDNCWCKYNAEQEAKGECPAKFKCQQCHTYITDGRIQFLSDCTHELAGQTVDLPEFPYIEN